MQEVLSVLRSLWVVWLVLLFLGIVFWAYRPRNRKRLQSHAEIPLRDDIEEPRT